MVRASADTFNLMELEVIEQSLFFAFAQDGGQAFAQSVRRILNA
jgi:hypothetical protein